MQAIILAAGMGRRLKELTKDNTKCMVPVNGTTLIDRMLHQLDVKRLSRIVVVTGYEGKKLTEYIEKLGIVTPIEYVDNPVYDRTNNIYSLYLARDYLLRENTLLFESDIIFEDSVLDCLIEDPRENLALVDRYEPWMDGTCLRLDEEDDIIDFVSGKNFDFTNTKGLYKTVNIYKFGKTFSEKYYVPFLDAYTKALGENEYYEQVLRVITSLDSAQIQGKRLHDQKWYEIDDVQDLDIAEALFCDNVDEKVQKMEERYGGYWRFTDILDYCYLVNPYYPPQKMKDEMRASFDTLLTEYPSGMKVNSLLAGKNFGVRSENIVVGNGAAELIKALMELLDGRIGFIRPTFEEYPNRYNKDESEYYLVNNIDYSYDSKDIMDWFENTDIKTLVLINPDNPSGNYIDSDNLIKLISWFADRNVNIVLDESFADFADEKDNTLIRQDILERFPNLCVMKSISKSYGIPGLRLGVLASGNRELIAKIKKRLSIWNINSFAEFYMQIAEKYRKDYDKALDQFRWERIRFLEDLQKISGLRVIPSQANYFMVELTDGHTVHNVTKELLSRYNILVKDLSQKLGNDRYMRIAIRSREDNARLVDALRLVMNNREVDK